MSQSVKPAVREALERVRENAAVVFEALLTPYQSLADAEPGVALGAPVTIPDYERTSGVRRVVEEARRNGRGAWALQQVEERQIQVEDLVRDYRKGLFAETAAADWVGRVQRFRDAVHADLNTAMQAPRGWDRLELRSASGHGDGTSEELLTPKDVAPQLSMGERTVRRKIQEGKLGPWQKQGSRWVIPKEAFLRFWSDLLVDADADVPRPQNHDRSDAELEERLVHLRLRTEGTT